ncbi:hypothetical protein HDU97_002482 [Phlyctochytrium planicorne]|nr:hypothetical protein HDU97_002482 [Phlyctochytrium planicorne]
MRLLPSTVEQAAKAHIDGWHVYPGYRHWRTAPKRIAIYRCDCDLCGGFDGNGNGLCNGCHTVDWLVVRFDEQESGPHGCGTSVNVANALVSLIPKFGSDISAFVGAVCAIADNFMADDAAWAQEITRTKMTLVAYNPDPSQWKQRASADKVVTAAKYSNTTSFLKDGEQHRDGGKLAPALVQPTSCNSRR